MNMIVIVVVLFVIGVFVNIGIVIMSRVCSFPDAIWQSALRRRPWWCPSCWSCCYNCRRWGRYKFYVSCLSLYSSCPTLRHRHLVVAIPVGVVMIFRVFSVSCLCASWSKLRHRRRWWPSSCCRCCCRCCCCFCCHYRRRRRNIFPVSLLCPGASWPA